MGRCKDCANWIRIVDDRFLFDEQYRQYRAEYMGKCSCPKFVYAYKEQPDTDGLEYWDTDGWRARFLTGEDFGCVHFKERK